MRNAAAAATLLTNGSQEIRLLPSFIFLADLNAPQMHTTKIYIKFYLVIVSDFLHWTLKMHKRSFLLKVVDFFSS